MDNRATTGIHGLKRPASDELDNEQPFTKRFNLLNLEDVGKLYISVKDPPTTPPRRSRSNAFSDSMNLDETRDRIYIHNLDDEISDIELEEEKLVFLPDIEKRLTKIPKSVLLGQSQPHTSNEVVLYSVPESLSIPPEQDNVRKAIIESRERARQKQLEAAEPESESSSSYIKPETSRHQSDAQGIIATMQTESGTFDEDAMDIG
ncbi:hypothetical protein MMC34_006819 [Xylographa carneopallida]|nr:hypothetical protein [Xylographa carneopallida]